MPFTLPENTFPALDLSKETQRAFALEAERIVYDTIDASEQFFASGKQLPPAEWKRIRSKENYNVYRQRNVKSRNSRRFSIMEPRFTTESTTQSMMSMDESEVYTSNIDKPAHVPMLIGHGSVDGKLEDVMLGVFEHDDESWRFKSTYVEDGLDDAKILYSIRGPTETDPYRSLSVKWFIRETTPGVERFIFRRDYLVIEATGIALDSQGRQLSYCLVHSKRIPQIRELHDMNIIRGKLSLCFVSHQASPTTVNMYCRGYSDACGGISVNLCAKLAGDNILASVNVVECGYMKKLFWLVRQQDARQRSSTTIVRPTVCTECKRSINKFGAFLSGAPCRVCLEVICTKCSVVKKLPLNITTKKLERKPCPICLKCLLVAKRLPASVVAMDDLKKSEQPLVDLALLLMYLVLDLRGVLVARAVPHGLNNLEQGDERKLKTEDSHNHPLGAHRTKSQFMPFTLPEGTFAPVVLSHSSEKEFANEAERIIADTVQASEDFYASGKLLAPKDWKLVKSKENFHVYKQRVVAPRNGHQRFSIMEPRFLSGSITSSISMDEMQDECELSTIGKPAHVPLMVSYGTIDGQLDDAIYGGCACDDESWRIKTVYLGEMLDDAKILATIQGPSEQDPFRYLGLKWFVRAHETESVSSFIQRRDFVCLDATGMTQDSKGQPVSFLLLHSIRLPQIRPLDDMKVTRGTVSICYISRQATPTTVDIYCRMFTDPGGRIPPGITAHYAAENVCAAINAIEGSYMKKLMWLMRNTRHSSFEGAAVKSNAPSSNCKDCNRSVSKFGGIFCSGMLCQLCQETVCGKCSVVKKLIVSTVDEIVRKPFTFCFACLLRAKQTPAAQVAVDEARRHERRTQYIDEMPPQPRRLTVLYQQ